MCMTSGRLVPKRVRDRYVEPGTEQPGRPKMKVYKRWKRCSIARTQTAALPMMGPPLAFGVWHRAQMATLGSGRDYGFHVYAHKRDALRRGNSDRLVCVEVAGLHATGRGDGNRSRTVPVETWTYIRYPQPAHPYSWL